MNFLKDLRIRWKLLLGFGIAIVFSSILAVKAIQTINHVDEDFTYLLNFPQERLTLLNEINNDFANMRRTGLATIAFSTDKELVKSYHEQCAQYYSAVLTNIDKYVKANETDTVRSPEILKSNIEKISALRQEVTSFKSQVVDNAIEYILIGDYDEAASIHMGAVTFVKNTLSIMDDLIIRATDFKAEVSNRITAEKESSVILFIILSLTVVILSITVAILIARELVTRMQGLVKVTSSLAEGDLSVPNQITAKDEIGILSSNLFSAMNNLKFFIDELNEMAQQHHLGEIDKFIDDSKYKGSYHELAASINKMVKEHIDINKSAIHCVSEMVGGNFDAKIERLPGKKFFINEAIEDLRKSLISINNEVNGMIENAVTGNLATRIDVTKYKGDWILLMSGLNDVFEAIMVPLKEVMLVFQKMSEGIFDTKMTGEYSGDYNLLKISVNTTATNISEYISEISTVLNELADNNLNLEITREYFGEFAIIKDSINNIIEKLDNVIKDIQSASEQVTFGAKQLSESSMSLAEGATEQAASVEELNAAVLSVSEKTEVNVENANRAKDLSNRSTKTANIGSVEMERMLVAMEDIKHASNNINNIIKTIDDIAFQTNLLALNAAVEAARAGDLGKGFAVVADEVRSLANRSQNAVKETTSLIENSIKKVNEGTEVVSAMASSLSDLVCDVDSVSEIISKIADASDEQVAAISQINQGVSQISEVVQINAATSEESASASQTLFSQSEVLKSMIQKFKLKHEQ